MRRDNLLRYLTAPFILLSLLIVTALIARAAVRDVVISEIAWMGTHTSPNDEWIELYNNTASPVNLAGWTLAAADGTGTLSIPLSGSIPSHSHFLLERQDDNSVPGVAADLIYPYAEILHNDGECLHLKDNLSNVVDELNFADGWPAGNGRVIVRVPMERVDTTADGSDPGNWRDSYLCGTATNRFGDSRTCTWSSDTVAEDFNYDVYFTDVITTGTDTALEEALLSLINGAGTSIDAALYGLNRQSIVTALIAAHGGGVTVRVVADNDARNGTYKAAYEQLKGAGIEIRTDADDPFEHNKFLVFDGQTVWTGSTNLTDTGFTANANNAISTTSPYLAGLYSTEFNEMWGGAYGDDKTDNTTHMLTYNGDKLVESYFSPTDYVAYAVHKELAAADSSIYFAMFVWTDGMLADTVIERMDAGVTVSGVWDALGAGDDDSQDDELCAAGAAIKIGSPPSGKVHHKFAVVDVDGSDPTVILGSYNWSSGGAYENDENTLIIHDATLAQSYYQEYRRLYDHLPDSTLCLGHRVYLPIILRQY
jgi:phosphatidylserine/phosphatidylglycerophosphate/cardiolipin synthase-like enzyme